jgi:hypothetical protein
LSEYVPVPGAGLMAEARVKAGIWVQMALRMGNARGRFGVVLRKGDPDAGGVLVVLRNQRGVTVLTQTRAANGEPAWMRGSGPEAVDQDVADSYVARQINFDPDLWVLEFESPDLLPPFEATIL